MEGMLLLAAAGAAGAGGWALGSGDSSERSASMERAVHVAGRWAAGCLGALASSGAIALLLEKPAWSECAEGLRRKALGSQLELDPSQACSLLLLGGPATAVVGSILFGSPLWLGLGLLAPFVGVRVASSMQAERRKKELTETMPILFRALSVAMGSGMTLVQSAEYAGAHVRGEVGEAFGRLALRMRCGEGVEEAIADLVEELPAPGVGLLASALSVSHRTGSPLSTLFSRAAKLVESQGEFERLLAVKTAQVRLSVRIVCLLPAVMVVLLSAISPDFQSGVASPVGAACLCVAALIDALAVFIIQKIVAGAVK